MNSTQICQQHISLTNELLNFYPNCSPDQILDFNNLTQAIQRVSALGLLENKSITLPNIENISITKIDVVEKLNSDQAYDHLTPLLRGEDLNYLNFIGFEDTFFNKYFVIKLTEQVFNICNKLEATNAIREQIQSSLDGLAFGMAIFQGTSLFLCNKSFSSLRLSTTEAVGFDHNEVVELEDKYYQFYKVSQDVSDQTYTLIIVYPNEVKELAQNQELGIIASSIAHEINNPLAGIIMGISLIESCFIKELTDPEMVADLKSAALRCKEIVDIFLGFAKFDLVKANMQSGTGDRTASRAFQRAFDLSQHRMVELNKRFSYECSDLAVFGPGYNFSVLAMIFYLVLNELMTEICHRILITKEELMESHFHLEVSESFIKLRLPKMKDSLSFKKFSLNTKLLKDLLRAEGFKYEFNENELSLWK